MNLNELPDYLENSLVDALHILGAAYFALKDDNDLAATATHLELARGKIIAALGTTVSAPCEDVTDISKESLRLAIFRVFQNVNAAITEPKGLRIEGEDTFAAECRWVEDRGRKYLRFTKLSLDELLSTPLLACNAPVPSMTAVN